MARRIESCFNEIKTTDVLKKYRQAVQDVNDLNTFIRYHTNNELEGFIQKHFIDPLIVLKSIGGNKITDKDKQSIRYCSHLLDNIRKNTDRHIFCRLIQILFSLKDLHTRFGDDWLTHKYLKNSDLIEIKDVLIHLGACLRRIDNNPRDRSINENLGKIIVRMIDIMDQVRKRILPDLERLLHDFVLTFLKYLRTPIQPQIIISQWKKNKMSGIYMIYILLSIPAQWNKIQPVHETYGQISSQIDRFIIELLSKDESQTMARYRHIYQKFQSNIPFDPQHNLQCNEFVRLQTKIFIACYHMIDPSRSLTAYASEKWTDDLSSLNNIDDILGQFERFVDETVDTSLTKKQTIMKDIRRQLLSIVKDRRDKKKTDKSVVASTSISQQEMNALIQELLRDQHIPPLTGGAAIASKTPMIASPSLSDEEQQQQDQHIKQQTKRLMRKGSQLTMKLQEMMNHPCIIDDSDIIPFNHYHHEWITLDQNLQSAKQNRKNKNWTRLLEELCRDHFSEWRQMIMEGLAAKHIILVDVQNMARHLLAKKKQDVNFIKVRQFFQSANTDWLTDIRTFVPVAITNRSLWIFINQKDYTDENGNRSMMSIQKKNKKWYIDVACLSDDGTDCFHDVNYSSNPMDDLLLLNLEHLFERLRSICIRASQADLSKVRQYENKWSDIERDFNTLVNQQKRFMWIDASYTPEGATIMNRLRKKIQKGLNALLKSINNKKPLVEIYKISLDRFTDYKYNRQKPTQQIVQYYRQLIPAPPVKQLSAEQQIPTTTEQQLPSWMRWLRYLLYPQTFPMTQKQATQLYEITRQN